MANVIETSLTLPQTEEENIYLFCKWLLEHLEMDKLLFHLKEMKENPEEKQYL